jgi:hypothetical protein
MVIQANNIDNKRRIKFVPFINECVTVTLPHNYRVTHQME